MGFFYPDIQCARIRPSSKRREEYPVISFVQNKQQENLSVNDTEIERLSKKSETVIRQELLCFIKSKTDFFMPPADYTPEEAWSYVDSVIKTLSSEQLQKVVFGDQEQQKEKLLKNPNNIIAPYIPDKPDPKNSAKIDPAFLDYFSIGVFYGELKSLKPFTHCWCLAEKLTIKLKSRLECEGKKPESTPKYRVLKTILGLCEKNIFTSEQSQKMLGLIELVARTPRRSWLKSFFVSKTKSLQLFNRYASSEISEDKISIVKFGEVEGQQLIKKLFSLKSEDDIKQSICEYIRSPTSIPVCN